MAPRGYEIWAGLESRFLRLIRIIIYHLIQPLFQTNPIYLRVLNNYCIVIDMAIEEGSLVRYTGTGTVGVVKVIKEEEGKRWALLDSTSLYYDLSVLEPIDKVPERKGLGPASMEDIQAKMEAQRRMMDEAKMQDANLETGG